MLIKILNCLTENGLFMMISHTYVMANSPCDTIIYATLHFLYNGLIVIRISLKYEAIFITKLCNC